MKPLLRNNKTTRRRGVEEPSITKHVIFGVVLIVSIVLVGTLVWYLTRREAVTLRDISVEGGETISPDVVRTTVERALSGNYLLLVPYRFSYLYPHDRIVAELNSIPRIRNVVLTRTSRQSLDVTYDEYVPNALWCLTTDDTSPCYFLDTTGFAFAPAPNLEGGSLTRYVLEGKNTLAVGQVLSADLITNLDHFLKSLEVKLDLRVYRVVYTKDGDLELWLAGGGKIFVTAAMDPQRTFDNLQSILTSKDFSHIKPGNFNYIDLRFGSKVYVNEEKPGTASTSSSTTSQVSSSTLPQ